MATDVWQTSALCDEFHLCDSKSWAEWEDAAELSEVSFSETSTTEVCISNTIKPARTSAVTTANQISPTVSMVTVALDCYCSNSTTGNSLQPWSLGGKNTSEQERSSRAVKRPSIEMLEYLQHVSLHVPPWEVFYSIACGEFSLSQSKFNSNPAFEKETMYSSNLKSPVAHVRLWTQMVT